MIGSIPVRVERHDASWVNQHVRFFGQVSSVLSVFILGHAAFNHTSKLNHKGNMNEP